jgi:hypothetical protein
MIGHKIIPIEKQKSYMFTFGKLGSKPDPTFKRWVREEIDKAMAQFDRAKKSDHSIVVKRVDSPETGDREEITFEPGKQYLYFDLNYTDPSAVALEEPDIEELQKEVAAGLEGISNGAKIYAIVLHDCTVDMVSARVPIDPTGFVVETDLFRRRSIWDIEGRGIHDRPWHDRDRFGNR